MTNLNTVELRECENRAVVIGMLKDKEVKYDKTKDGTNTDTISVKLTIVSDENLPDGSKRIHENQIRLWAKKTSKLFSSYQTVANEYKAMKDFGDKADMVQVTGSFELNEYAKDGVLKQSNNIRGVFVNRLEGDNIIQEVGAQVECVVTGVSDEMKDGKMTGRKKVNLLSVGYNSRIHEFQNVFVQPDLANDFTRMFTIGSTAMFTFKIDNYSVEVEQEQNQAQQTLGFGRGLNTQFGTVKNYFNEAVIIGGSAPYVDARKFTNEQIAEMKKLREMAQAETLKSAPATPPITSQTGFGVGFGTEPTTPATTPTADVTQAPVMDSNAINYDDMPF